MKRQNFTIETTDGKRIRLLVLRPARQNGPLPGILWLHGGGYTMGGPYMVYVSRGKTLASKFGAVVAAPAYRRAGEAPYPAALEDCYAALRYLYDHAEELGVRRDQIIVGGESAGGGLTAALCLYARDKKEIPIVFQIPLYPMLDCLDTPSSRDNHALVWNTRRNHRGWARYLGELYGTENVPGYASPARAADYRDLPPAYTYVTDGEPFYAETLTYVRRLNEAGVPARADVYHGNVHAFDNFLFWTKRAREARKKLCDVYADALSRDFRL